MNAAIRRGVAGTLERVAAAMPFLGVVTTMAAMLAGWSLSQATAWFFPPIAANGLLRLAAEALDRQAFKRRRWWIEPAASLVVGAFASYWYLVR